MIDETKEEPPTTIESSSGFRSGLTWRSVIALLYSLFVFSPAVIYLQLVTIESGSLTAETGVGGAVEMCTLLLFSEIAALYGSKLTTQEATIIFGPATVAGGATWLGLIYRAYFVRSPILNVFKINPSLIPKWWAPSYYSPAFDLRTFSHSGWILPIAIMVATHFLSYGSGLFFGFLGREMFIEGEMLEFPMEHVTVAAISTLADRSEDRMAFFSFAAVISFFYGILLYTIPTYTKVALAVPIVFLPIPWADYTITGIIGGTIGIQWYMPGASFGVATDLMVLGTGFFLPSSVVLGLFIGSFARFIIANWLLVKFGWTAWAQRWTYGMDLTRILQDSTLYFWLNPLIGIGFAVGLIPLLFKIKTFIRSMKVSFRFRYSDQELKGRISGPPVKNYMMLYLFVLGPVGFIILEKILVPDFPLWPLILYEVVFPFISTLSMGRIYATTGTGGIAAQFPYMDNLLIMASGYPNIDAWFLPLSPKYSIGWIRAWKICELTKTTLWSWLKVHLISYSLLLITGCFYVSLLWEIAPIPSSLYPTPDITWPLNVMQKAVWITRPEAFFIPTDILYSFIGFGALLALSQFIRFPFSPVSLPAGFSLPIPLATTMLIGTIVNKILSKMKGKDWVNNYKGTVAAGLSLGEGIAIIIGVALALASKSIYAREF